MRIVSLCPSITETLIELGAASGLVGITRFCTHPRAVTKTIPKVGGTKDPDIEAILEASPDIVLLNEEENTRETFDALTGHVRVDVTFPRTVAEVPENLRHFGRLIGREQEAEEKAVELERALEALELQRCADDRPTRTLAYLVWRDPWMAAGPDTYVSDLFRRGGAVNVLADASDRYPVTTLDTLRARQVDIVVLPDEPFRFRRQHQVEIEAAIPRARVELVSGDDCCWHGARSVRGVRLVAGLLLDDRRDRGFAPGQSSC